MKIKGAFKGFFIFVLLPATMIGCPKAYTIDRIDYRQSQKEAAILVGDPQVYSRASLINDRRQETEYLKKLLTNSEVALDGSSRVKFTPQIVRDLKTVEALSASLGLSIGKAEKKSSVEDIKKQIEATKLEAQLAVLQKQVEAIKNAPPPDFKIPAPDASTSLTASDSNSSPNITKPDLSALQTSIKSIQDRLKELAQASSNATAPGNDYTALIDPRDDFMDRQALRRDYRAASSEAQLDNIHDRAGNALYRLQFQVTVLPPNGSTRQWGATKMEIEAPKFTKDKIQMIYFNWITYISAMLTDNLQNDERQSSSDYNYDRYIGRIASSGFFYVVDFFNNTDRFYCFEHQTASNDQLRTTKIEKNGTIYKKYGTYAVPFSFQTLLGCQAYPTTGTPDLNKEANKTAVQLIIKLIEINRRQPPLPQGPDFPTYFFEGVDSWIQGVEITKYSLIPSEFCKVILNDDTDCDKVKEGSSYIAAGGDVGHNDFAVNSYSVLPGELVQRLGVTTESSQSMQTALSIAAQVSAATQGGLDIGYLSQSGARAEALSRQPLVVGFAGSGISENDALSKSYFGWLFGPQFVVKDPDKLGLEQTVRKYGVNSDISIPGWWEDFTLNVYSAWIGNWSATEVLNNSKGQSAHVKKRVRLPLANSTYESLTNFIAAKAAGEADTQIFVRYLVPDVVPACTTSVTFQIGGANLWRADSIFLGGAKAKTITVLPDMNGVAAEFDMTEVFGTLVNSDSTLQSVPLTVSAEQGSAAPRNVYVVGTRQTRNGATTCQSPLMLPTTLSLLPPTVISTSPSDICMDAENVPLVIQGLNLVGGLEPGKVEIKSDYFDTQDITAEKTQIIANLKPKARGLPKKETTALIIVHSTETDKKGSIAVNVKIKDCQAAAKSANPLNAHLLTNTVKIAKDQEIKLKMPVPAGYSEIRIAVRLHTKSDDAIWKESSPIKVVSGDASELVASMDLSDLIANPKDKLDLIVKIRNNPTLDWKPIPADKPLVVESS